MTRGGCCEGGSTTEPRAPGREVQGGSRESTTGGRERDGDVVKEGSLVGPCPSVLARSWLCGCCRWLPGRGRQLLQLLEPWSRHLGLAGQPDTMQGGGLPAAGAGDGPGAL